MAVAIVSGKIEDRFTLIIGFAIFGGRRAASQHDVLHTSCRFSFPLLRITELVTKHLLNHLFLLAAKICKRNGLKENCARVAAPRVIGAAMAASFRNRFRGARDPLASVKGKGFWKPRELGDCVSKRDPAGNFASSPFLPADKKKTGTSRGQRRGQLDPQKRHSLHTPSQAGDITPQEQQYPIGKYSNR